MRDVENKLQLLRCLKGGTKPDTKVSGFVVLSDIGTESRTPFY